MEFGPCYRSLICLICFKSGAVVYLLHMCRKAVPGSQRFSVKKCGRKAVGLVSLVLQQKIKTPVVGCLLHLHDPSWAGFPSTQGTQVVAAIYPGVLQRPFRLEK